MVGWVAGREIDMDSPHSSTLCGAARHLPCHPRYGVVVMMYIDRYPPFSSLLVAVCSLVMHCWSVGLFEASRGMGMELNELSWGCADQAKHCCGLSLRFFQREQHWTKSLFAYLSRLRIIQNKKVISFHYLLP